MKVIAVLIEELGVVDECLAPSRFKQEHFTSPIRPHGLIEKGELTQ